MKIRARVNPQYESVIDFIWHKDYVSLAQSGMTVIFFGTIVSQEMWYTSRSYKRHVKKTQDRCHI